MVTKTCPLCELAEGDIKTKLYYQDKRVIIVDCSTCGCPMCVSKKHFKEASPRLRKKMIYHLTRIANEKYGKDKWVLDEKMRKVHDHCHIHSRPLA